MIQSDSGDSNGYDGPHMTMPQREGNQRSFLAPAVRPAVAEEGVKGRGQGFPLTVDTLTLPSPLRLLFSW